jgi:hypothetical protein
LNIGSNAKCNKVTLERSDVKLASEPSSATQNPQKKQE